MEPHRGPGLVLCPYLQVPPKTWILCDDAGGVAATGPVWLCGRSRRLLVPLC